MQGKDQVTVHFDLFPILLLGVVLCLQWKEKPSLFYILGDVLCLHQIGSHEPVEFGEFGIDPVERDQVLFQTSKNYFVKDHYYFPNICELSCQSHCFGFHDWMI